MKSSKSSKKNGKPAKFAQLQPDPSMWLDFDQLKDIIHHITIYFQPRCFKDKTMISDLQFPNKAVDFRYTISRQDQSVREPIYLFMDSVDYKFVIFNLCQMGNTSALQKIINGADPPVNYFYLSTLNCLQMKYLKCCKIPQMTLIFVIQ